jgi:hypothetical protein
MILEITKITVHVTMSGFENWFTHMRVGDSGFHFSEPGSLQVLIRIQSMTTIRRKEREMKIE